ncbi:MAG: protein-L-isoaspartate(D-aspartate) O-methyltransferase [Steroidobacteraceae bacterium]|jgi:protein-L-isoaspartate(D-aspartate) O-methyltransferase|nr:protein-L-isoaspartate(D-aspartate) O-methyltransferase [Steroidobacteraceae bacterium]
MGGPVADVRLAGIGMTSARTRDRLVQRLREQGIRSPEVLDRIRNVPRHIFVDEALSSRAYEDTALPIGHGQTISQPYIVARMTEALLEGGPLFNVLEVGTGCGYQTAVLAPLVDKLYSIERIEPLLKRAKERIRELGIKNVRFRHGDGYRGWPTHAPYDGMLVAAAPLRVPDALLEQLKVGGRLIVPVGPEGAQELVRFTRREQKVERQNLGPVAFVPLLEGTT